VVNRPPEVYTGVDLHLGLDLGHDWQLGPLYVALAAGAGVAYCGECSPFTWQSPTGPPQLKESVNLNLLRMGAAF
jgi:hypothetical protein